MSKNQNKGFALAARLLPRDTPTLLADASLSPSAQQHMRAHFSRPLFLAELLPPRRRTLLEDDEGRITLAYELIETHVCAAAHVFLANMLTQYAQAVCYERDGVLAEMSRDEPRLAEMSRERPAAAARKECIDLYGREEAVIKASRVGRGWF